MKIWEFVKEIENIAPVDLQESWDNSGWQISLGDREIRKVLFCLDVTKDVVEEAVISGANLIVSHHPLMFAATKKISADDFIGEKIIDLIKNNIDVYSAHTNFDECSNGNNEYTAGLLGLQNIEKIYYNNAYQFGRTADLPYSMSLMKLAEYVAEKLQMDKRQIRFSGAADMMISRVAICTGAGSEITEIARNVGCQAVITGDVSHHKAVDAVQMGLGVIDATHYDTEINFKMNIMRLLNEKFGNDVVMIASEVEKNPFSSIV